MKDDNSRTLTGEVVSRKRRERVSSTLKMSSKEREGKQRERAFLRDERESISGLSARKDSPAEPGMYRFHPKSGQT